MPLTVRAAACFCNRPGWEFMVDGPGRPLAAAVGRGTVVDVGRVLVCSLMALVALSGCSTGESGSGPGDPSTAPAFETVPVVECLGVPGRLSESSSYRPGAPSVPVDGTGFEVKLRVLDGACSPVEGVLVEIWHTGDRPEYSDDRWRTALRTDRLGSVSYVTVRPVPGEGPSHFHVRVDVAGFGRREWVLMPGQEDFLDLPLLLVHEESDPSATGV